MFGLDNQTVFEAGVHAMVDTDCVEVAVVTVKGTFSLDRGRLSVAPTQRPLLTEDAFHGAPGHSSVRYESDICAPKLNTDVALIGHARAKEETEVLDVTLRVGKLAKTVRVFGERHYERGGSDWQISEPVPFRQMPLVYERAFGAEADPHNPVGIGNVMSRDDIEGALLPNLENPADLISGPTARPAPAGFGFIARHWSPRAELAGTCDEDWMRERMPLLPSDFDARYHQSGHPDLCGTRLAGDETVEVTGVTASGEPLTFRLPGVVPTIETPPGPGHAAHLDTAVHLDTVLFEPDRGEVVLTWRAGIPCGRRLIDLQRITVRAKRS